MSDEVKAGDGGLFIPGPEGGQIAEALKRGELICGKLRILGEGYGLGAKAFAEAAGRMHGTSVLPQNIPKHTDSVTA